MYYLLYVLFLGLGNPEENTAKYLENVAVQIAKDIASGKIKVDRSKKGLVEKLTATAMQWEFVKNIIFKKAREQVMKASRGLYPAPLKVKDRDSPQGFKIAVYFYYLCSF